MKNKKIIIKQGNIKTINFSKIRGVNFVDIDSEKITLELVVEK